MVHVQGRLATSGDHLLDEPEGAPVCSALAITRVGAPRNHSSSPSSLASAYGWVVTAMLILLCFSFLTSTNHFTLV